MTLLCRLPVEHVSLCYVLTMGVFTTSWWVVNQPIVMSIFDYAFTYCCLLCIRPFEACHFMVYVDIMLLLLYDFAGRCPVLRVVWVWHPRDYVREAYKQIGHAEISNF